MFQRFFEVKTFTRSPKYTSVFHMTHLIGQHEHQD